MRKRVIIFTVGFHARVTLRHLRMHPECEVLAFVDNNPATHGTTCMGVPVLAPAVLRDLPFDLVAVPGRNQGEIQRQLHQDFGICDNRVWLVRKSEVPTSPQALATRGQALVLLLRRTLEALSTAGLRHWVLHSSLLALARGQDLAQFSDVDIGVDATGFDALPDQLRVGFQMEVFPHPASVLHGQRKSTSRIGAISLTMPTANSDDEPAVIDLHAIALGAEEAWWWVDRRTLEVPAVHFAGRAYGNYRGVTLPMPLETPKLLTSLYGADWQTPAEIWNGRYAVPTQQPAIVAA